MNKKELKAEIEKRIQYWESQKKETARGGSRRSSISWLIVELKELKELI